MPRRDVSKQYDEVTVLAAGARTASGDSGIFDGFAEIATLRAQLNVTAVSGTTPNLTAFIEDTLDGTNWNIIGTFTARTAVGREVINVTGAFADRIRVRWAISGTNPSFNFSVIVAAQSARV